jgi:Flp pilus assembly pilin Flp
MLDRINIALGSLYSRLQREEGQTMAEYALILGLIVVVTAVAWTTLGTGIHNKLNSVCTSLGVSAGC